MLLLAKINEDMYWKNLITQAFHTESMNRITSVAIAFMLTVTTMGTGSLENPEFERINNTSNGFDSHENDTLHRTNTFPFDVLFDDYHEYYEVVSEL